MTLVLLHEGDIKAAHNGRVVKKAWVPAVRETQATLDQLHDMVAHEREAGFAEGKAAGEAEAHMIWNQKIMALTSEAAAAHRHLRTQSSELAIEIVRKLAPSLGAAQLVPALAERLAQELVPTGKIDIYVHPDALAETRMRLASLDTPIEVWPDEQASLFECRIETTEGRIDGSLHVQLDALENAFAANTPTDDMAHPYE